MSDILFELLKFTVIVTVIVVTRYLVPFLKSQVKGTKYEEFIKTVMDAVKWAEQTIGSGQGALKKQMVVDFLSQLALDKNINITAEQLEVLIESAVLTMKEGV